MYFLHVYMHVYKTEKEKEDKEFIFSNQINKP